MKRFRIYLAREPARKPPRGYTFNVYSIEIYRVLSRRSEFAVGGRVRQLVSVTLSFSRLSVECTLAIKRTERKTHARSIPRLRVAFRKLSEILTRAPLRRSTLHALAVVSSFAFRRVRIYISHSPPAHSFPNRNGEFMKKSAPHLRTGEQRARARFMRPGCAPVAIARIAAGFIGTRGALV